jgi:hypothetical protein
MDWPYKFPHPADVIAEEAAKTACLPFEERFMRLLDLIAAGDAIAINPTTRDAHRRLKERSEAEWQRANREVFERHGR